MKNAIDDLSDKELELYNYAESLVGTMESRTGQLSKYAIFDKYKAIHRSYLDLFLHTDDNEIKLEILKRLIFLNWYSLVEPSCFTGIEALDYPIVFDSYSILNDYLISNKIDNELKWMLSYYSCWDYIILGVCENKLSVLASFVKEVDSSIRHAPQNQLSKGSMDNRGQMGVYWISCSVEKRN